MLSYFEQNIATFARRYLLGYDYLAILYKIIIYFTIAKKLPKHTIRDGYNIEDVAPELKGSTFFGYYDRSVENGLGDYIVINEFKKHAELRVFSNKKTQLCKIDLPVWNFQQGVLATWLNDDEVIYNTLNNSRVVACRYNIRNLTKSYLEFPLQAVSLDGLHLCSIDMRVIRKVRPEYAYEMCNLNAFSANKSNLIVVSEVNGVQIIGYDQIREIAFRNLEIKNFKINHCMFSPSARYLFFLARGWNSGKKLHTLMCLDRKSNTLKPIILGELVSHYNFMKDDLIVFWGTIKGKKSYYLVEFSSLDEIQINKLIGDFKNDGHPTPVSESEFITDTYPNRSRISKLQKISIKRDFKTSIEIIAELKQPFKFFGSKRVDLHPRVNPSGSIYIDSGHSGMRRMYKISVSK